MKTAETKNYYVYYAAPNRYEVRRKSDDAVVLTETSQTMAALEMGELDCTTQGASDAR